MKPKYALTKLSSGDHLYVESEDAYVIGKNLEMYCCIGCIKEAKENLEETNILDTEEENLKYVYELMGTACGAEFWLEEREDDVEKI